MIVPIGAAIITIGGITFIAWLLSRVSSKETGDEEIYKPSDYKDSITGDSIDADTTDNQGMGNMEDTIEAFEDKAGLDSIGAANPESPFVDNTDYQTGVDNIPDTRITLPALEDLATGMPETTSDPGSKPPGTVVE